MAWGGWERERRVQIVFLYLGSSYGTEDKGSLCSSGSQLGSTTTNDSFGHLNKDKHMQRQGGSMGGLADEDMIWF